MFVRECFYIYFFRQVFRFARSLSSSFRKKDGRFSDSKNGRPTFAFGCCYFGKSFQTQLLLEVRQKKCSACVGNV